MTTMEITGETMKAARSANDGALHAYGIPDGTLRAALEAALPYLPAQPVASRGRIAEVLRATEVIATETGGWDTATVRESDRITDALLAAGVFREPQPECGAVDRSGQRRCVFTPGHHEVENWTSHGDRGGWTWNDQPAED